MKKILMMIHSDRTKAPTWLEEIKILLIKFLTRQKNVFFGALCHSEKYEEKFGWKSSFRIGDLV